MMASSTDQSGATRFNWKRTWALSGAIAIHVAAILMMLSPAAPPQAKEKAKEKIVQVEFIKPPPMPPPPAPPPPVAEQSAMSVAATPTPPAPPAAPVDIAPSQDISYNNRQPPRYPISAVRQHQQGTVYLLVLVGPDGSVQDVKVDQSSGYRDLDRAAIEAARKWKFNPGSRDGKPVGGWVKVPVQFKLSNLGF